MAKLDFRMKGEIEDDIYQPDFKIQGYNVEVVSHGADYRVIVGCQKYTVSAKNIQQMLDELQGVPQKQVTVQLILSKKAVKDIKTIVGIPQLLDSSENFWISKNQKIYPKETYTILDHTYTPDGEYFNKRSNGTVGLASGYGINTAEAVCAVFLFNKLKEVLLPTEEEILSTDLE